MVDRAEATAGRFSITRVRLRNYRSFTACDVGLGPLAVLVGPNASGKTGFLYSLRLVADGLRTTLDQALRDQGGAANVLRHAPDGPTDFGVRVDFTAFPFIGSYAFQIAVGTGGEFHVTHEDCQIQPVDEPENGAWYRVRDGQMVAGSEPVMPPLTGKDRLYLVTASGLPAFRAAFDGLSSFTVYNFVPDVMRRAQPPDAGESLRRDGSNVASVLERLARDDPGAKDRIETYLRRIVPSIDGVTRADLGAYTVLEVLQQVAGSDTPWSFPATSISDGTLRALGALTALFSGSDVASGPIGIEEPESALHPSAAGLLLDALRDASDRRQVLVTSHSPDLLDPASLRADELLAVSMSERRTVLGPVDDAARHALDENLFTAGELMRVNQLAPAAQESLEPIELFT